MVKYCYVKYRAMKALDEGEFGLVSVSDVQDILRSFLGSAVADAPGFAEGFCRILRSYVPWKDEFASLARRMEDYLFNALYERLGSSMTVRLDDGSFRRIRIADLPSLVDGALYPFFASLDRCADQYERLHSYWMKSGSFSAMRALYLCFPGFLPEQERRIIERIVRENIPFPLQNEWFTRKDDTP